MPVNKGSKLLEDAISSPFGWRRSKLDRLYEYYGFTIENKRKHDIVTHSKYSDLRATLTRSSKDLHPAYIRHAVDMIKKLLEREG